MNDWKDLLAGLRADMPEDMTSQENSDNSVDLSIEPRENGNSASRQLTIFYERKGRAGKPATIITGFNSEDPEQLDDAENLARKLKRKLGCGGSARGGEILLQGDRRRELKELLLNEGYKVKGC